MSEALPVRLQALSQADALAFRAQQAVAAAMGDESEYRIVGGNMVRMLLSVYPAARAVARATLDADAAVGDVEVIVPFSHSILDQEFIKAGGSAYTKEAAGGGTIEINLLLARDDHEPGLGRRSVEGVGEVDTLPELSFAMLQAPLILEVTAELENDEVLQYRTKIPGLEAAVVLKAHSWKDRRAVKELADLHTLMEIRDAHPEAPWRLDEPDLMGRRKDTARIVCDLSEGLLKKRRGFDVPTQIQTSRMAALLRKHIAAPGD